MTRFVWAGLFAAQMVLAGGIDDAVCRKTGAGEYEITFQAEPGTGSIEIWSSTRPDSIDSKAPILVEAASPANVTVTQTGRIYFHLKPEHGRTRVTALRRPEVDGSQNLRDLGGYRTEDGRYVRWGLVYGSGLLSAITPKGYAEIAALHLRLVCDLRTDTQREDYPTKWIGDHPPEFLYNPISLTGASGKGTMDDFYKTAITEAATEFGTVLHRISKGDLPMLIHCIGGTDRTGLSTAFLLSALGVPRKTVVDSFGSPRDMKLLLSAFQTIEDKFGSFDRYLRDGLKVSDAEAAAMRKILLEP